MYLRTVYETFVMFTVVDVSYAVNMLFYEYRAHVM
jgi:hypothetical protein